jgi:hypothetical protein
VAVMGIPQFERFFRAAAGLDVDKSDLKRYSDFVHDEIHDLLIIGQATAKANVRDVIQPEDLPITKGLQERIHEFRKLDEEIELQRLLEDLATRPPLDLTLCRGNRRKAPAHRRRAERGTGPELQDHRHQARQSLE